MTAGKMDETTIRIDRATREAIKNAKRGGETYDDVILRWQKAADRLEEMKAPA